jgi:uncharacterized protein (DUF58 family)
MLAYLTGVRLAFVLVYVMALAFAVAWIWLRFAARGLHLDSTLEAAVPAVGEPFEEHFELTKSGIIPAPIVEIRDQSDIPRYRPGRVVALGRGPVRWRERGIFTKRGWARFGPTRVCVSEPFGLFRQELTLRERDRLLVYPKVYPIPDLITSAEQQSGDTPRFGAWADHPPEAGGVRDYASSDSYGRIHWPLSLKHGRLVSKTFEQPLTADMWLVLDLDRKVHAGTGAESTLEYAVSITASIATHVFARGRSVGLVANDARGTVIEPTRAGRHDRAVLDFLALAQADGPLRLAESLARERVRRLPRRSIAVITPSADPDWLLALRAMAGRRTALLVFYIDAQTFGAPQSNLTFDFGSEVDLYVIRSGDDLSRLTRMRDAVRVA